MALTDDSSAHETHALLPFLKLQSPASLTRLYIRPSACLALFRLLTPLARQLVMSLLWLEGSVAPAMLGAWAEPSKEGRKAYDEALRELMAVNILPREKEDVLPSKLSLNPTFKAGFRQALTGGGTSGSFGIPAPPDSSALSPGVDALDAYALERWETILHYMVSSGTGQAPARPSPGVLFLLQRAKLMTGHAGSALQITSEGFQFLLHSPHTQLWELLLQYLKMTPDRNYDVVEVLSVLCMLSTTELGQEYSTENLTAGQIAMLEDLRDYGFIYQRDSASHRFSPTRLATTLTSSLPALPSATPSAGGISSARTSSVVPSTTGPGVGKTGPDAGFIVLETNYRIYAYTDNPLQTAVLNLFVSLKARFPNLVIGQITRDSVKKALQNGITAEQIISYLTAHAHPQMRKNNPLIPVTVQDQIRLWELEKNRLKSDDGFLYTDFQSQGDYEYILEFARKAKIVKWENASKRSLFVEAGGHDSVKQHLHDNKNKRAAGV